MRTRGVKIKNSRTIKTDSGIFHRGLETSHMIYFVNFNDFNEDSGVKMYNRSRELISENKEAYKGLKDTFRGGGYSWVNEKLKEKFGNLD